MHSIAHVLLFGSMVAAAIGALTFCLVLAAFGFTPAEGQPDEVARRERFARIGRLVAGTGFGLAALLGVVGVAASPSRAPSLQPQLEALRGRLGDMTTRLGHIADLADHLRVHVGDWMPAPRRAETPTAAIDRGERSHTDRAAITLPDRAPVSNTPAASALPERDVRTTVRSVLPHTVTSREIRATTPEPSPPKQQSPAANGDVASAPAPAPDRPVTRRLDRRSPSGRHNSTSQPFPPSHRRRAPRCRRARSSTRRALRSDWSRPLAVGRRVSVWFREETVCWVMETTSSSAEDRHPILTSVRAHGASPRADRRLWRPITPKRAGAGTAATKDEARGWWIEVLGAGRRRSRLEA